MLLPLLSVLMFVQTATPAGVPLETAAAAEALRDLGQVCEHDGVLLWGKSLCGPLVLVNPRTRAAIANSPDPDGKFHKDGDVYIGNFPAEVALANTSIRWKDQAWATVMLPLAGDPFERLRLLAHESFHRLQPALGLNAHDTPNAHLDTEAGRLWLRLEMRALARALRSEGAAARQSAADAMLFRTYRYRLFPGAAEMEAAMEKQEGLAEYTGTAIALRASGEDITREARWVEAFEDRDAFARSFAYATGPALGLLLDRYDSHWREHAATASLFELLSAALKAAPPADLPRVAQERAALYGYRAIAAAEREREVRHKAALAELTRKFVEGPVLDFPPAKDLYRTFNPNSLIPFPPHGTYYPTGTFTAPWGKLEVQSGGALLRPDFTSLRVAAPPDPNARPIRGDGWVLELAPGWTIRPAGRSGSFALVPPEPK